MKRRAARAIIIHFWSARPAADIHVGRAASGPRFAVNFLTSLHKSLSPTANGCFHKTAEGFKKAIFRRFAGETGMGVKMTFGPGAGKNVSRSVNNS
jgi:hypothetical protein